VRVLSIGFALPNVQIDNHTWAGAPAFYDYDAVIVNPAAVSSLIEGVAASGTTGEGDAVTTYNKEPVINGFSTATEAGLRDVLVRRREEIEALLGRGGLVVCFAYPDVPHPHVAGFTGCHRYYWLPAPAGRSYGAESIRAAEGAEVVTTDYEHPFAEVLELIRTNVRYRARFLENEGSLAKDGRVIGRSSGGAAIALDVGVGGGRVIFIPALPESAIRSSRERVATTMVNAIRNLVLTEAEGPAPEWLRGHELPGIAEAEKRLEKAETAIDKAEAELDEARNEFRAIDRFRRVLWQEGKYGLELPVRDALKELGFTTNSRPDDPAVLTYDRKSILLETQGGVEAVGMDPHYRLRQRLEVKIADGQRPLGLIVINGYRDTEPAERPLQYKPALRVAAESMRYCVVTTADLFAVLQAKLNGDETAAESFARRLIATEGVFTPEGGSQSDGGNTDDESE
jgi:hypothetical protein